MDEELWLILVYGLWNDKEMAESKSIQLLFNAQLFSLTWGLKTPYL